jgi:hypothetical protein
MKKTTLVLSILLISAAANAQLIIQGADIDINNVKARINNQCAHFWDPIAQTNYYEVPAGSNKKTIFAGNLWIGGYDNSNQLHVAAETYNQNGSNSWWPGPLDISNATAADANTWNFIWKIDRSTILNHINNWNTPGYIIPNEIATWPGNPPAGTNYAPVLAPFFDSNANQIYEPALGEFPVIYGDQAIYFICNDNFGTSPLGVPNMKLEVHGMAFAFNDPARPFIDNTVFFHYEIGNRSGITYHDVAAGLWTDADLGNPSDDYFGTDVARSMYYFYNGDADDEGLGGYGIDPPAQGVIFLNPSLSTSVYYQNTNNIPTGNPVTGGDHYNYLTSTWLDGQHVTYGDDGRNSANPPCNYMFPDLTDTAFTTSWTMGSAAISPDDMRGVGSATGITLNPGQALTLDVAYTTAFPDSGTGVAGSITVLGIYADSILARYASGAITAVAENAAVKSTAATISILPNPLTDYSIIQLHSKNNESGVLRILSVDGKIMSEQYINANSPILIQKKDFASGIYFINAIIDGRFITEKMIVN